MVPRSRQLLRRILAGIALFAEIGLYVWSSYPLKRTSP